MPKATMPEAEQALMLKFYRQAGIILEYGSGSSTCVAAGLPGKFVMSVESDLNWARDLRAELSQGDRPSQAVVYHVDIGRTGSWGRPVDEARWRQYHRCPNDIWSERFFRHPDVILIDGRFRTACLASAMMQITRPVTVLFDDYVHRPKYRLVERMIRPCEIVGRMARFEIRPGQFPAEQLGFAVAQFFEVSLHGEGHSAYKVRQKPRYQDERKLMVATHTNEDRLANDDAKRLIAENTRLQQELGAALMSEAAEAAAAGELKARIFDMSQQQLRQLEQIADREDALALAAAREDDLKKRLMRAEREVIAKQDEMLVLTTAVLDLRKNVELARKSAGCVPKLTGKLRMLEGQIAEIKASTSWRVTRPLRKIKDGLKFLTRS